MIWCKNCPRCNGDLVSLSDTYGEFISCLQCGCILNEQQGLSIRLHGEAQKSMADVIAERMPPERQVSVPGQTRRVV